MFFEEPFWHCDMHTIRWFKISSCFELSVFFFFCEKEERFCDWPAHSLTAHTQQEEESAALENALSQPVKTGSPDFM